VPGFAWRIFYVDRLGGRSIIKGKQGRRGERMRQHDRRREARFAFNLPARISVGSQLSLQGRLKDLSFKSAFIEMKNSVYLDRNDAPG